MSDLSLDIAEDFTEIADWLKPVTVDGNLVQDSLRRAVSVREAEASAGKYLTSDVVFHLPQSQQMTQPEIGAAIADASEYAWTILAVENQTLARRWRCVCRLLWIDPSLTVTIQSATFAKGSTGAVEPTWSNVATGVVAKIQYQNDDVNVEHGNRSVTRRAFVYFAANRNLGPSWRIIAPDSTVLKVLSWDGLDDISKLFRATCEVSKWPEA